MSNLKRNKIFENNTRAAFYMLALALLFLSSCPVKKIIQSHLADQTEMVKLPKSNQNTLSHISETEMCSVNDDILQSSFLDLGKTEIQFNLLPVLLFTAIASGILPLLAVNDTNKLSPFNRFKFIESSVPLFLKNRKLII